MKNKRWKGLSVITALIMSVILSVPVQAASNNPKNLKELFDAEFYAYKYPEVVSVLGNDEEALYNHFVEYGLNEGRTCSPYLNVAQYRANYADVAGQLDHHWDDIVNHYFTVGVNEGRQSFVSEEDLAIQKMIESGQNQIGQNRSAILSGIENAIMEASNSATGYTQNADTGIIASADGVALVPWNMVTTEGRIQDIDELAKRCGDNLVIIRDSYNRIKFVGGKFSNVAVKDESSALQAIDTMADLYNFDTNRNYLKLSTTGTDSLGNPFYRFVSIDKEDGSVNSNYTVTLSADKDGNVLGASNSNISSLKDKAKVKALADAWGNSLKDFFEDPENGFKKLYAEPKLIYNDETKEYLWAYYYESNGLVTEVLVDAGGSNNVSYTRYYDAETYHNNPSESFNGDYQFKNIPTLTQKSFIDFYGNEVKLPVAYEEGKGWYIVDPERKIICTESSKNTKYPDPIYCDKHYFTDDYFNAVNMYLNNDSLENNTLLENEKVLISAFTTIQMSYDENKAMGMLPKAKSIYVNFRYDDTEDNAFHRTANDSIEFCIYNNAGNADFAGVAHEFGHAVVFNQGQSIRYEAAPGAINESYADIIGSLLKMIKKKEGQYAGNVDFERWLLGEFLGNDTAHVIRNMSDPTQNGQGKYPSPIKVNDEYFVKDTGSYDIDENDNGGVHKNNSILTHICYRMYNEVFADKDNAGNGIPDAGKYRDLLQVWYDSVIYINNDSTYSDIKGYVLQAMKNHGYQTEKLAQTQAIFDDANVDAYKPFEPDNSTNNKKYDGADLAAAAKISGKAEGFDELHNYIEGKNKAEDVKLAYELAYYEYQTALLKGLTGDDLKKYEDDLTAAYNSLLLSDKETEALESALTDSQTRLKRIVDDKMSTIKEQEKELKKVQEAKEDNPNLERAYRSLRKNLKSNVNDVSTIIDAVEEAATEFTELDEISGVFSDVWDIDTDDLEDDDEYEYLGDYHLEYDDYPEGLDAWDYYDYWTEFWDAYWEEDYDDWYGNYQDWDDEYNYYDDDYSDEDYWDYWDYWDDDWYDGDWYYEDDSEDAVG